MKANYQILLNYISRELDKIPFDCHSAVDRMWKCRCSLATANDYVWVIVEDAIRDFCIDYDIDYYDFDAEIEFNKNFDDIFLDALKIV